MVALFQHHGKFCLQLIQLVFTGHVTSNVQHGRQLHAVTEFQPTHTTNISFWKGYTTFFWPHGYEIGKGPYSKLVLVCWMNWTFVPKKKKLDRVCESCRIRSFLKHRRPSCDIQNYSYSPTISARSPLRGLRSILRRKP